MRNFNCLPKKTLTARIAPIDLARLKKLAAATGKKPTAIVREILVQHLDRLEQNNRSAA